MIVYEFWQFVVYKELVHFYLVVSFMCLDLFLVFSYFQFNVHGFPFLILVICGFHIFILVSPGIGLTIFLYLIKETALGFSDFLCCFSVFLFH